MVFKCQEDSFLKTFTARVVRCSPASHTDATTTPPTVHHGFEVVLDDTVLFPEGGGQPSDRGTLNGLPVLAVRRHYAEAIHFVLSAGEPLAEGSVAELAVDWPVRLDHMQQHSGQHLITAVLERDCGWDTGAWYMGAETSFVQLNVKKLDEELLRAAERRINAIIAEGCEVTVVTVDPAVVEVDEQITRATRGLPADHVGAVRIVTFAGIESNMCCGTHVRNLSQLQAVQLLHWEPNKGGVQLHFRVGGRVLRYAAEAFDRERRMNVAIGAEPAVHVEMVGRLQEKLKAAQRLVKRMQKELAVAEARQVDEAKGEEAKRFYFVQRKDGAAEGAAYLQALQSAVRRKDLLLVGIAGEETNTAAAGGKLMLQGPAADVDALAPVLCELLEGKGAGKNGRFQAKVNSLKRVKECEARVSEYFERLSVEK